MQIEIRRAINEDASILADLGARTFRETYTSLFQPEDLEPRIKFKYGITQQKSELAETGSYHFLSIFNEQPCGFIRLRSVAPSLDKNMYNPVKLDRIYVLRNFQGHGIGKLLMNLAIETAQEMKASHLWLGVLDTNKIVMSFYANFDFEVFGEESFTIGHNIYKYILLAKPMGLKTT